MTHQLKIELNQNDCDENVVELLNLAGIDVIISGKNASNDTSTSRASVNGIGFSEKTLNRLIKNEIHKVSDLHNSFKQGFKNIKYLSKDSSNEIIEFIAKSIGVEKIDNFVTFSKLSNRAKNSLIKAGIYDISKLQDMSYNQLSKYEDIVPSALSDILFYLSYIASPNHTPNIESDNDSTLVNVSVDNSDKSPRKTVDKLSKHLRTSTKNLDLSEEHVQYLLSKNLTTLASIKNAFDSCFEGWNNTKLEKEVKEVIVKLIFNLSSIEKDNWINGMNYSNKFKRKVYSNGIYSLATLLSLNDEEFLSLLGVSKDKIDTFILEKKEKKDEVKSEKIEEKSESKETSLQQHDTEVIIAEESSLLEDSKALNTKELIDNELLIDFSVSDKDFSTESIIEELSESQHEDDQLSVKPKDNTIEFSSISKEQFKDDQTSDKKEVLKLKTVKVSNTFTDLDIIPARHNLMALNIDKKYVDFLHDKGIYFVEDLFDISHSRLNSFDGLGKNGKDAIEEAVNKFRSSDKDYTEFKNHSINELGLPHQIKLKFYNADFRFIEDLEGMNCKDLMVIEGIGKTSAQKIITILEDAIKHKDF